MDPIIAYIKEGLLPEDKYEAEKVRWKFSSYWISKEGKLYNRSYTGPYLSFINPEAPSRDMWKPYQGKVNRYSSTNLRILAIEHIETSSRINSKV